MGVTDRQPPAKQFSESFKLFSQDIPLTTRPSWPPGDFLGSSLIRNRRLTLTCWQTWWREGQRQTSWSLRETLSDLVRKRWRWLRHLDSLKAVSPMSILRPAGLSLGMPC